MGACIIQGYFPGRGALPDLTAFAPRPAVAAAVLPRALQARPSPGMPAALAPPRVPAKPLQLQGRAGHASVDIDPVRIGLQRGGGTPLPGPLLAIDNRVYAGNFPDISADAAQIHAVIPATIGGKANRNFGATPRG